MSHKIDRKALMSYLQKQHRIRHNLGRFIAWRHSKVLQIRTAYDTIVEMTLVQCSGF